MKMMLPEKFRTLRPVQDKAQADLLSFSGKRILQTVPTGVGKSRIYMAWAAENPGRTAVLTSTKALMDQLIADYGEMGVAEVRGKDNYPCARGDANTVKDATCHYGVTCSLRNAGCQYYDAIRAARNSKVVVTNYAFWLNSTADTLGPFDRLAMDEAHDAPSQLADFLSVRVDLKKIDSLFPGFMGQIKDRVDLNPVIDLRPRAEDMLAEFSESPHTYFKELRLVVSLLQAIDSLYRIVHYRTWYETDPDRGLAFADPLYVDEFSNYLERGVGRILMTSATATGKTADLLGVKAKVIEYPSPFPVENRPVIYVPTVKVDRYMGMFEIQTWLARINSIIRTRLDRKGIIHSVSYERAKLMQEGPYRDIIYTHSSRGTADAIRRFKKAKAPAILLSPAVTTGYDFPYEDCEYQVIGKVPFPNASRGVDQQWARIDRDLPFYLAWQAIVQAAGRGMRAVDDRCQTFIVDDHFEWLLSRYSRLAPKWFLESISTSRAVPEPLPKIRR